MDGPTKRRRLPKRWRRLIVALSVLLVAVLLQVVPETPFLPDLAT